MKDISGKCPSCGQKAHDFETEEAFDCIPPQDVLKFGEHTFNREYRDALFNHCPSYRVEEIVGSYLGHNPSFPSQSAWLEEKEKTV